LAIRPVVLYILPFIYVVSGEAGNQTKLEALRPAKRVGSSPGTTCYVSMVDDGSIEAVHGSFGFEAGSSARSRVDDYDHRPLYLVHIVLVLYRVADRTLDSG
jgi:hypothetical protein